MSGGSLLKVQIPSSKRVLLLFRPAIKNVSLKVTFIYA